MCFSEKVYLGTMIESKKVQFEPQTEVNMTKTCPKIDKKVTNILIYSAII